MCTPNYFLPSVPQYFFSHLHPKTSPLVCSPIFLPSPILQDLPSHLHSNISSQLYLKTSPLTYTQYFSSHLGQNPSHQLKTPPHLPNHTVLGLWGQDGDWMETPGVAEHRVIEATALLLALQLGDTRVPAVDPASWLHGAGFWKGRGEMGGAPLSTRDQWGCNARAQPPSQGSSSGHSLEESKPPRAQSRPAAEMIIVLCRRK